MDVKKELNYAVREDFELTAEATKSFYELKQFKLLLDKLSQDLSEEDSNDVNHIMKKNSSRGTSRRKSSRKLEKNISKSQSWFFNSNRKYR